MARDEHALDGRLPLGDGALERLSPVGDVRRLRAQAAAVGRRARQPAVGFRDRALGVAQRVARLALRRFAAPDLLVQPVDAPAQCLELVFLRRSPGRERGQRERDAGGAAQAFTFPCAATEAVRLATSSASPR
jgi:hypothetical protein